MGKLPTLLIPGYLVTPAGESDEVAKTAVPIDYIINKIGQRIPLGDTKTISIPPKGIGDKVAIFKGKTASGKTVTVAPRLYKAFFETTRKNIACLQPKVMNVLTVTPDAAEYNGMKMGRNIGYQTGILAEPPFRGVIYMTTGTLLQQLKVMTDEEIMDRYSFIILDECHDRSLDLDMVMYLLKKLLIRNWKLSACPFIICMSATFDQAKFMAYFDTTIYFEVEGSSYPTVPQFLKYNSDDFIKSAIEVIGNIHKESDMGTLRDIIVFVPGVAVIMDLVSGLEKLGEKNLMVISLTRESVASQSDEYKRIFSDTNKRRVIIATNVAETGVTIETIGHVVDTGFYNSAEYYPTEGIDSLITKPITKGMATQRRGRAGRKGPGVWYPLYTEESFNNLMEDQYPDIIKSDISLRLLDIILSEGGNSNLLTVDLMDLPSTDSMHDGLNKLYMLGAIDCNSQVTALGKVISNIRKLSIENIRMILAGYAFGAAIEDLIAVASLIQQDSSIFVDQRIGMSKFNEMTDFRLLLADEMLEFIFIFNYVKVMKPEKVEKWLTKHNINFTAFTRVLQTRDDTILDLAKQGFDPFANADSKIELVTSSDSLVKLDCMFDNVKKLKRAMYEGYKLNLAVLREDQYIYRDLVVNSTSSLISQKMTEVNPKYIITNSYRLAYDRKKGIYKLRAGYISVLDGFVAVRV